MNNSVKLWDVPPIWKGETFVIFGGGPSITQSQVNQCKENARTIAINDAYKLAPWADILYGADYRWWKWHDFAQDFLGVRVGLAWNGTTNTYFPGWEKIPEEINIRYLEATGTLGLEKDSHGVRHGYNSGYQAINLAVHLGAKEIVLLGYDMRSKNGKSHWFGNHPESTPDPPFEKMIPAFQTLLEPLEKLGIKVVNCTKDSALGCFPIARLEEVV